MRAEPDTIRERICALRRSYFPMTPKAKQVRHVFCLDGGRLLAEYNGALKDWADRAFALIQDVRGQHDLYK